MVVNVADPAAAAWTNLSTTPEEAKVAMYDFFRCGLGFGRGGGGGVRGDGVVRRGERLGVALFLARFFCLQAPTARARQ
jgi:hypothetical protein